MSSTIAIAFRRLLDIRVLAALVGVASGVTAAHHGWQSGLVVYATGLGLLYLAQWIERDTRRVIQRMKDPANIAP